MTIDTYQLLALCARAECSAAHYDRLAREAARLTEWEGLPTQAEAHGLAPLFYIHLRNAGVQLPSGVKRELQGLYLRHRRANQIRTDVLRRILLAYESDGIQAIVLKGAALSHIVYPEPGLRAMSDLDVLVRASDARRAQSLLTALGFKASLPDSQSLPHRHLTIATFYEQGLPIQVEIHHKLLSGYLDSVATYITDRLPRIMSIRNARASTELNGLTAPPRPFALADLTAYTLGHEDMLRHLYQHLTSHVNVWDFGRLIWTADIVSYAEHFASEIDWEQVRRRCPAAINTLSLLHFMTPLSDELLDIARIKIGRAPKRIGTEFQGWPRTKKRQWQEKGYRRIVHDTLFPSEWWLRLRYGVGSVRPLFWYRWVRHPLHILGHIARTFLERLGWPTAIELAGQGIPR